MIVGARIPKGLKGKRCEVCRGQATIAVRDVERRRRVGSSRVEFFPDGPVHWFCETHQRDSQERETEVW